MTELEALIALVLAAVVLAAAARRALAFPFRDLIVLTAFFVVLGTLVLQGLTLGPLLRRLNLQMEEDLDWIEMADGSKGE